MKAINTLVAGLRHSVFALNRVTVLTDTAVLLCVALLATLWQANFSASATIPKTLSTTAAVGARVTPNTVPTSQPTVAKPVATPTLSATHVVADTLNCVPVRYGDPTMVDLSSAPVGLTQTVAPAQLYQVYGNTGAQIAQQVKKCAPQPAGSTSAAEFVAQTTYQLTWSYDIPTNGDATCSVSNAKIGLNIATFLPSWQPGINVASGLTAKMQAYLSSLSTHEKGHAQLDQQYAAQMLSNLQNFPAGPCTTLNASVKAMLQQDVNALNMANDSYDARTDHGATQGAVLPS